MACVTLKNVSKIFEGGVKAVDSVNIDIRDMEFVVLVGPSGCGKSTTLRMVAGLEEISEGEIYIGDRLVNNVPPKDRDIAMVFQNYALYPHMSVYDNMAFGLKLRKYPKNEIRDRVEEAASILGLESLLDRKPKALSGGQRQRVAVGRAIVRKPKVFLFDEPLSNLDAKLRVQMRAEISKLHDRLHATMIYVTHDQIEAMTMGDRIVVMKDGIIQQIDTPLNLYHEPVNKFVAGFIGSPPMNFFSGKLIRNGGLIFKGQGLEFNVPERKKISMQSLSGKDVEIGVRPEDIVWVNTEKQEETGDAVQKIKAEVEVVEPMGNEVILYLKLADHSFISRIITREYISVHSSLWFSINMEHVHFFDPETNKKIF